MHKSPSRVFFFLGHASPEILETLLHYRNITTVEPLFRVQPAGKLCIWGKSWKVDAWEACERRCESRGGGGGERKESLQWSLQNFHFHPAKTPGTTQSVKTVTANVLQIRKSNNCLSSLDSRGCIEIIDLLISLLLQQLSTASKTNVFDHWLVFFFIHWTWNFNMPTRITTQ